MTRYKDISGQRFGKLIAVSYAGKATSMGFKSEAAMWNCQCDCGNTKVVRGTALRNGHIASCGCEQMTAARDSGNKANDITGQRFGLLTALFKCRSTGTHNGQRSRWVCQCDCGAKTLARSKDLVHGTKRSCGCQQHPTNYDLIGRRFGRLVVIGRTDKSSKSSGVYWECRCDCGRVTKVPTGSLNRGNTKSCGCARGRPSA